MDTIRSIMPYFSFVLSCVAMGISIASLQSVEEDLKIMTELINLVEKEYELRKR